MRLRRIAKIAAAVLLVLAAALAIFWFWAWRSPPYHLDVPAAEATSRIVPFARYGEIENHARPYVVDAGSIVVFGATHTRDPADPQLATLESAFEKLAPTVVLVEGRLGFLLPGIMDPVVHHGEGGKANALARAAGARVYNWDLPKDVLARRLVEKFTQEQVSLYVVLLPYFSKLRFGKPASPDDFVAEFLHRAAIPELGGAIRSVADIDRVWQRDFPGKPDWRDTSDEYGLPGYLGAMMAASNDARNEHLVRLLLHLRGQGERVLAVTGSSHAACVEPALREDGGKR
ncbi:hypothetical protein [Polyangium aurulentum]|uniref:hypothetical protein n=1 Tax=Polyangium aurulentum TaxID=2567896 RepID=UPI0010ADE7FC|nr:hypothetical protein [Polyangium aurulentum]UQA59183.1 hypothetical protein E8A73_001295 [Polyangium aurulentum]